MKRSLVLFLFFLFAVHTSRSQTDSCSMKFGMNFIHLSYWNREMPFVDMMKMSSLWVTQNSVTVQGGVNSFDTGVRDLIPADSNGYPLQLPVSVAGTETTQVVMTQMAAQQSSWYPSGEYICLYDGEGVITFSGDASIVSQTSGRIVVNVTATNGGIRLKINSSTAGNHLRNIRFLMPGTEGTYQSQPFTAAFLNKIAPFNPLRFMSWQLATVGQESTWATRKRPMQYTQATYFNRGKHPSGVAYEYIVQLCNQTNKDAWVSVPHTADSLYVVEMARFFKQNLNPNLKIYLEYSNEVWNYIFPVNQWVNANGPSHLNLPQKTAYFVKRAFDTWSGVFGAEMSARVVRVAASQHTLPWVAQQMMAYLGQGGADAIAPAAYYVLRPEDYDTLEAKGASASSNDVARMIRSHFPMLGSMLADHRTVANQYNLRVLLYEGGGEIRPRNANNPSAQAIYAFQSDTAAYNVNNEWFQTIRETARPDYFVFFHLASKTNDPVEGYGALESVFQPSSQKYQVLLDNICSSTTGVPLAVELSSFTGTVSPDRTVRLVWRTSGEIDNSGFEVERSSLDPNNGVRSQWKKIGFLEGNGTTDTVHDYHFVDREQESMSRRHYRLKQIDRNGASTYSEEIVIDLMAVPSIFSLEQNFPNPFNPETVIGFTLQETGFTTLKVYDMLGREVRSLVNERLEAGVLYQRMFNASDLAGGIYFAELISSGRQQIRKMLLLK
jgi:hypothetical protein